MKPPAWDTIEISLFGPGYGEAIAVHLGFGEWIIIDSCIRKVNNNSINAAIYYLQQIGVDLATQVKNIVATHWHDDHIRGMANSLELCTQAKFCCPIAFQHKDFLTYAALFAGTDPSPIAKSTEEIMRVFKLLQKRRSLPKFLSQDRLIRKSTKKVALYALSPSDKQIENFFQRLVRRMPKPGQVRIREHSHKPNQVAAGLLLKIKEDDGILLGADLEESPGRAWSTIISSSEVIRDHRSNVYKVAHHGSASGDCAAVWDDLLHLQPIAILTPFVRGRHSLPSERDVDRILSRTPYAYSSARLASSRKIKRNPTVERTIRESNWKIQKIHPKMGQIRLRRNIVEKTDHWKVKLLDNAVKLEELRQ